VYASTSVDWVDAVDAAPTAMHAVGDGHEIALSPALTPLGTTGGDWDQVFPFHTWPMTRPSMRCPRELTRHDSPTDTQNEPPLQETPYSALAGLFA